MRGKRKTRGREERVFGRGTRCSRRDDGNLQSIGGTVIAACDRSACVVVYPCADDVMGSAGLKTQDWTIPRTGLLLTEENTIAKFIKLTSVKML